MFRILLAAAVICGLALPVAAPPAVAEEVAVLINDAAPGTYLLTVNADRSVSVNPIRVVRPGANPVPPPTDPPPGPQSPAVATSKLLAEQALAKPGATKQTGAGLSAVYSAVSREINSGGLDPKLATAAIALGVNEVYKKASPEDKAAWTVFSTSIARALSEASVAGDLATTGKWVAVLDDFHKGIDLATGIPIDIGTLSTVDPKKAGILDGIDLQQLIELIKLIMEIIKAFSGGF